MKYERIIAEFCRKPWAILPEKLTAIAQFLALQASGVKLTDDQVRERIGAGPRPAQRSAGSIAVLPLYGAISHRANMMSDVSGGTSTELFTTSLRRAMADSSISTVVLDVDSPGGDVDGVPELASEILEARKEKRIVAVANTMAASAAYWLASAATELVVTPSGSVGSIGVFAALEDISKALEMEGVKVNLIRAGKFKYEGNPYEPLTDEARADIQAKVDSYYEMFVKAVARNRGASQAAVRDGFGQGRMVLAGDAVKEGMADSVATLDQTLDRLGARRAPRAPSAAMRERELALYQ